MTIGMLSQDISGKGSGLTGMGLKKKIGLRLIGTTKPCRRRRIMGMGLARRRLARGRIMGMGMARRRLARGRIMGMGLARRRLARRRIMGSLSTPGSTHGEELEEFSRIEVDGLEPLV